MTSPRFALPPRTHHSMSRRSILTTGGALLAAGASSPALAQAVLGEGKTPPHLRFLQPETSSKLAGYSHVVEATLHLKGATLRAQDRGRDPRQAVNLCEEELTRQVKRHRDKRRGRRKGDTPTIRGASPEAFGGGISATP